VGHELNPAYIIELLAVIWHIHTMFSDILKILSTCSILQLVGLHLAKLLTVDVIL